MAERGKEMNIFDQIREEFIGDQVSVRDRKGNRVLVKVIQVTISCNENHANVRLTVDNSEENCDKFYDLFMLGYSSQKNKLLPAFTSIAEYNTYYGICEHVRFIEVK